MITITISRCALRIFALAAPLALAMPSMAEMANFKADLKGASEVPPNGTKGSDSVTATYDTGSKKLSYKGSYSGLTGPATAAHFHGPAEPGSNAGVQIPASTDAIAKGPFEGEATLTDAQASELMAGKWYFNIHTAINKGGEIRGQVTK
jgi:CHRD domain